MLIDNVWNRLINNEMINALVPNAEQRLRKELVVVKIQNVYDYYAASLNEWKNENGTIDIVGRFPNVAPPWPLAWFEWKAQQWRMGLLLSSHRLDEPMSATELMGLTENQIKAAFDWLVKVRFGQTGEWIDLGDNPEIEEGLAEWVALGQGYIQHESWDTNKTLAPQFVVYICGSQGEMKRGWDITVNTLTDKFGDIAFLGPVWMAITFLHCKNTKVVNNPIPLRLRKARVKKGKFPGIEYKTLVISKVQEMLEVARKGGASMPMALHICRGHFKDYREGRGLFGKHKGIFWWDMHVRGTKDAGIVVKDYEVKPR